MENEYCTYYAVSLQCIPELDYHTWGVMLIIDIMQMHTTYCKKSYSNTYELNTIYRNIVDIHTHVTRARTYQRCQETVTLTRTHACTQTHTLVKSIIMSIINICISVMVLMETSPRQQSSISGWKALLQNNCKRTCTVLYFMHLTSPCTCTQNAQYIHAHLPFHKS